MHVHVDLSLLPTRGSCSKYELDIAEGKFKGKLELTYESDPLRVRDIYKGGHSIGDCSPLRPGSNEVKQSR